MEEGGCGEGFPLGSISVLYGRLALEAEREEEEEEEERWRGIANMCSFMCGG